MHMSECKIAAVLPCYKVRAHILDVIRRIGPQVSFIFIVDDCCPDGSGAFVRANCDDARVTVLTHSENQGVGGAVMTGYRAALDAGADVIVKIDGDGQMDPALIDDFVAPIAEGEADYTKGNRFFDLEGVRTMPRMRLFGNAALSFLSKLSSGYWDLFDPTNGYTAIHRTAASHLPFGKISKRYFFETDMLFRLNTLRAVVVDIPMEARYADEVSHLKISKVVGEFLIKHIRNFGKRIFYNYYLRDMSVASVELPLGLGLVAFGTLYGASRWMSFAHASVSAPSGTVMLAGLTFLVGVQFLLAFIGHDVAAVPRRPLQRSAVAGRRSGASF